MNNKPTLAFATMCKDEEHCIRECLDSVKDHVDYILVHDTGSTDNTIQIVKDFLQETGIPGEIFEAEWQAFDINKNMMMEKVKGKTDYVLHFDADDFLRGDFGFTAEDAGKDQYNMTVKRGGTSYSCSLIYNNNLTWKFAGVAHTIIKALDKQPITNAFLSKGYLASEPIGSRIEDPNKYRKDAENLEKQFWRCLIDDPDGLLARSCFYAGQSWLDHGNLDKALQWKKLYMRLTDTWIEEQFEAQHRIGQILIRKERPLKEIKEAIDKAISLIPDRAEPYLTIGRYLNGKRESGLAYDYLKRGKAISLENAQKKYLLFVNKYGYGNYFNDELSVACYWTGRYSEGLSLINQIKDDPEFAMHKERFDDNIKHFNNMIDNTEDSTSSNNTSSNNDPNDIFATTI
jgi:glycosyltransferase involved in cell wall biosynthesis